MLCTLVATAAFVGQAPLAVQRSTVSMLDRPVGVLPTMYRNRWSGEPREETLSSRVSIRDEKVARIVGAVLGASVAAAIGFGASTYSTDTSLSMLGAAGLFNEHVLFTDILMRWADRANTAGNFVLPLAVLYLMQAKPSTYLATAEADLAEIEEEACLIAMEEPVCGKESFDSTDDGMICVEDYSRGSLRWVCG
jgi:hypothetical protein